MLTRLKKPCTYLEVGVEYGITLEAIKASRRIGVDPFPQFVTKTLPPRTEVFVGNSDSFFSQFTDTVDLVFLDGLHEAKQTYRDLINSLNLLSPGGLILVDDVYPSDEASALPDKVASDSMKRERSIDHHRWFGDIYKIIGAVRQFLPNVGILFFGSLEDQVQAVVWKLEHNSKPFEVSTAVFDAIDLFTYEDFRSNKGIWEVQFGEKDSRVLEKLSHSRSPAFVRS